MSVEWWDAVIAGVQELRNQAPVRFDKTIALFKSPEYKGQAQPGPRFTWFTQFCTEQQSKDDA